MGIFARSNPTLDNEKARGSFTDRVAVLARHAVEVDDPLLSVLAGVRIRDYLTVRNDLAQCGLTKAPELADVRERHEVVEGRCCLHSDAPQLIAGKVQLVVPDGTVSALIHLALRPPALRKLGGTV